MAEWAAIRYSADHILDYVELDDEHAIFEISVPETGWEELLGSLTSETSTTLISMYSYVRLSIDRCTATYV